ncbi:MAG: hypothetical protein A2381_09325 [Bdellovibrionales bacterium RIFOXYB1_FULL_37_110]|nr:MAG: hypothetical protein A2417_14365 [Bdellovibrionales bacterium RIFOXYC1_FULL_37_79]OFZ56878.1 MAG: hypothetical protein A2381_09325 [Bdellovibrionales bacterium RIFOXYB1_FULL_37_110]OFZ65564.1 MAG: hypothetical protein A2577_17280 [Bdellovibrionales bacterium RIFOXYD1_FULL_36_51]
MSRYNSRQLFLTLKMILKSKKLSYKKLAGKVSFSESTLKNIFYAGNASLERIIEICNAAEIEFPDLVNLSSKEDESEFSFTLEQEKFLADHPNFYYYFREIFFEKKSLEEMERKFKLTRKTTLKYLKKLEEFKLLEVHPNNRIKFLKYGKLKWIYNGPWTKKMFPKYSQKVTELLIENLDNSDYYSSLVGYFSLPPATFLDFKREVNELEKKYKNIAFRDYLTNDTGNFIPVTWIFNILPVDIFQLETHITD